MDIFFHCDKCGHGIAIDESCAGMVMKCTHCAQGVTIPSPASFAQDVEGSVAATATATATVTTTAVMVDVAETEAPAITCPFCIESMHKGLVVCAVCANPLPESGRRVPRLRVTWLGVCDVVLAVLIAFLALYTYLQWNARKTHPVSQAASMAAASFASSPVAMDKAFASAATATMSSLHEVYLAIRANADHDTYMERLAAVSPKLDELLRVAGETGLYKSNTNVREFCTKTSSIFLGYNQALEQWDLELLLRANKDTVKAAHELVVQSAADKDVVDKSLAETTAKLSGLTAKVMKAMENRYDLWLGAEKDTRAAAEILIRLRG